MSRCLYCYQPMEQGHQEDFHASCSKKMFGQAIAPEIPYSEEQIGELATQVIQSRMAITGVQPKISLSLDSSGSKEEPKKFTIVGFWGAYILKPASAHYPQLPEVEDLTMHLASIARIAVVPHSLIRMKSGNLAYITKRIDRLGTQKRHMEDMCQLTERLSEDKYQGSYERIAKTIARYATNPGLDTVNFFEQVLFSFLTGNADMHLKNFSLIRLSPNNHTLAPGYDMLATALVNPSDLEELALTLNGKKNNIKRSDFETAFTNCNLGQKQQANIFKKMAQAWPLWLKMIDRSFITDEMKPDYKNLLQNRFGSIGIK